MQKYTKLLFDFDLREFRKIGMTMISQAPKSILVHFDGGYQDDTKRIKKESIGVIKTGGGSMPFVSVIFKTEDLHQYFPLIKEKVVSVAEGLIKYHEAKVNSYTELFAGSYDDLLESKYQLLLKQKFPEKN